jgi:predicted HicB family RNase H-like nuclease
MEVEIAKPRGVQRSKEEIISILEECRKGKMNVKEFVKTKGIHEATYYNWRNKYGSKPRKERSGFATIKINPSAQTDAVNLFAEVRGIKIYHYVPSTYLKELNG